jgi:hypothetical protein
MKATNRKYRYARIGANPVCKPDGDTRISGWKRSDKRGSGVAVQELPGDASVLGWFIFDDAIVERLAQAGVRALQAAIDFGSVEKFGFV